MTHDLIGFFAKKLGSSDYDLGKKTFQQSDIIAFIYKITEDLEMLLSEVQNDGVSVAGVACLKLLLPKFEPAWTALKTAV